MARGSPPFRLVGWGGEEGREGESRERDANDIECNQPWSSLINLSASSMVGIERDCSNW